MPRLSANILGPDEGLLMPDAKIVAQIDEVPKLSKGTLEPDSDIHNLLPTDSKFTAIENIKCSNESNQCISILDKFTNALSTVSVIVIQRWNQEVTKLWNQT